MNDFVCAAQRLEARAEDTFVAMTVVVVEAATGEISIATAGAEPPLLLRADGSAEEIRAGGVPVGFLAAQEYASRALRLDAGDTLLLATDGLTEARCGKEFLGYEGMMALAQRAASRPPFFPTWRRPSWMVRGSSRAGRCTTTPACC